MQVIVRSGERIGIERVKCGMSIRELSRRTGVNSGAISKIENGQKIIWPRTARAIADALKLPFEELFETR